MFACDVFMCQMCPLTDCQINVLKVISASKNQTMNSLNAVISNFTLSRPVEKVFAYQFILIISWQVFGRLSQGERLAPNLKMSIPTTKAGSQTALSLVRGFWPHIPESGVMSQHLITLVVMEKSLAAFRSIWRLIQYSYKLKIVPFSAREDMQVVFPHIFPDQSTRTTTSNLDRTAWEVHPCWDLSLFGAELSG